MSGSLMPDTGGEPRPLNDGIDELAWSRMASAISAVGNRDAAALRRETGSWPTELPLVVQNRISLYLRVLLGYRTEQILGMRPSAESLSGHASAIYSDFHAILPLAGRRQLEEALRMSLNMPPLARKVSAADFGAFAIVALGVMLDMPQRQLPEMRAIVAAWWQRNLAVIPERLHLKSG